MRMDSFAGRVVVITGAAHGIGRELAHRFCAEGARVAAIDCQAEPLARLAQEMKCSTLATAVVDVTDLNGLRASVAELEGSLGPTDLLIANAGIGRETSALVFRAEDIAAQVEVN